MNKEVKQEINRAAYFLAQQQFACFRRDLETQCRQMVRAGKPASEIVEFLQNQYLQPKELGNT